MIVPDRDQSQFNSGVLKQIIMREILTEMLDAKRDKDVPRWIGFLDNLRMELVTKMNPREVEETRVQIRNLQDESERISRLRIRGKTVSVSSNFVEQISILEERLRMIHKEGGYEGKDKADSREAISSG